MRSYVIACKVKEFCLPLSFNIYFLFIYLFSHLTYILHFIIKRLNIRKINILKKINLQKYQQNYYRHKIKMITLAKI